MRLICFHILMYSVGRKINSPDMFVLVQALCRVWCICQALLTLLWRSPHGSLAIEEKSTVRSRQGVDLYEDATLICL